MLNPTELTLGSITLCALLATAVTLVRSRIRTVRATKIVNRAANALALGEPQRALAKYTERDPIRAYYARLNKRNPGGNSKQRRTQRRKIERERTAIQ